MHGSSKCGNVQWILTDRDSASLSYCINVKNIRNVLSNEHAIVTAATKRALIDVVNHQFSDNDRIRVQWQQPHRSVLQRVLPAPQPDCIPVKLYDYQLRALSWYV